MHPFFDGKIHETLLLREQPLPGDVGVEIEAEFLDEDFMPNLRSRWWKIKDDQSLRNIGKEYVTNGALSFSDFSDKALADWDKASAEAKFHKTSRTSVHVHVNCNDMTGLQVFTFLTLAWLVEDFLVGLCHPQREGNVFCLRVRDAEFAMLSILADISREFNKPREIFQDTTRYAAINLKSLAEFGSVEFRCMRGIYKSEELRSWVKLLHDLRLKSLAFDSPKALLDAYLQQGKLEFLKAILDEPTLAFVTNRNNWEELLDERFLLLNTFSSEIEVARQRPKLQPLQFNIRKIQDPNLQADAEADIPNDHQRFEEDFAMPMFLLDQLDDNLPGDY